MFKLDVINAPTHILRSLLLCRRQALYDLGARKFALIDVPPIGCCPYSRSQHPLGACIDGLNGLAKGVNDRIKLLLANLSSELDGVRYTIGSSYNVVLSMIADPAGVGT